MTMNRRRLLWIVTIVYTLMTLYFLFLALGRVDAAKHIEDNPFHWIPDAFFKFPKLSFHSGITLMDLVTLWNYAAFIPFGILIPMLYNIRFIRFMLWFVLIIFGIEFLQKLTMLGSGDINDVLQNSIGACIGYVAYRAGERGEQGRKRWLISGMACIVLFLMTWGTGNVINQLATKVEGPFVAMKLETQRGAGADAQNAQSAALGRFSIKKAQIIPEHNMYDSQGGKQTYTFMLKDDELVLTGNYGIPDHAPPEGEISILVDGEEVLFIEANDYQGSAEQFEVFIGHARQITIQIEGSERLWDIGYRPLQYRWER